MAVKKETDNDVKRFIASAERLNHLHISVPTIHYHYTSINSALKILRSKNFRLSHPDNFNDPYDLDISVIDFNCDAETFMKYTRHHNYEFYAKDIPTFGLTQYNINEKTISEFKSIFKTYRDKFGVGCFSGVFNNTLMWSHYAQSHKGICIGFDYQAFKRHCFVYPVKYVKKKLSCNYFDCEIQPLFYLSYLKSNVWKYEKEIRVVHFNTEALNNRCVPFNKDSVLRVYFGLKTDPEDKEKVLHELKKSGYTNAKVFDMIPNEADYGFLKPKRQRFRES